MGVVKRYTGTAWADATIQERTASAWTAATPTVRSGGVWQTGTGQAVEYQIGEVAVGPLDDSGNAGLLCWQDATLDAPAEFRKLSFYVQNPAGQLYLAVYDNAGALVAQTAVFTPVAGWNTVPVTTPVQKPAGTYWLAYTPSNNALSFKIQRNTGTHKNTARAFSAPPATLPTAGVTTATGRWTMAATVFGVPNSPPAPALTITGITPNPAPAGPIAIDGTGFTAPATVSIGGASAPNVVVVNANRINCTAPAHADGAVPVTVTTSAGTSNSVTFTYRANTGTVTPMAPSPVDTDWDRSPLNFAPIFDDFDGPAGAKPNSALWQMDFVNQTPGQLNGYSEDCWFLDGQSHLVFEARRSGSGYLSARMTTRQKMNFAYGRVASSIKMPKGQGMMTAFWMLGQAWPNCSEIDIVEMPSDSFRAYQTLFSDVSNITSGTAHGIQAADFGDFSAAFHEYWVERMPDVVKMGIDGRTLITINKSDVTPQSAWLTNRPMHVNYFLDIGGNWAGPPNASTVFPMRMLVDWFRYTPM